MVSVTPVLRMGLVIFGLWQSALKASRFPAVAFRENFSSSTHRTACARLLQIGKCFIIQLHLGSQQKIAKL